MRDATFALLEEVGYERLQLTDVAERAGVNKTTVYRRWSSKAELIAELFADLTAEEVPTPDTGSLAKDLEVMLGEVSALLDMAAVRAALRASMTLAEEDTAARAALEAFWDHRFGRGSAIIARAIERGELPAGTDPRRFQEAVFGPLYLRKLIVGEPVDVDYLKSLAAYRGPQ